MEFPQLVHFTFSHCTGYNGGPDELDQGGNQYIVHDVEDPLFPQSVPGGPFRSASDGQIVSQHERLGLVRGLSQRHIQMIAIAGAIVCGVDPHLGVLDLVIDTDIGHGSLLRTRRLNCYGRSIGCPFSIWRL